MPSYGGWVEWGLYSLQSGVESQCIRHEQWTPLKAVPGYPLDSPHEIEKPSREAIRVLSKSHGSESKQNIIRKNHTAYLSDASTYTNCGSGE